jgi:hypothetical protein
MFNQVQTNNKILLYKSECDRPVLIQTGSKDESIRYFAPVIRVNESNEFLVYISERSLLLDLVKLKRTLDVQVSFEENIFFNAEISCAHVPALLKNHQALVLTLRPGYEELDLDQERCCPTT